MAGYLGNRIFHGIRDVYAAHRPNHVGVMGQERGTGFLLWFLFRKRAEEKRKIVTFRRVHEEDVRRKEEEEKIAHDKA